LSIKQIRRGCTNLGFADHNEALLGAQLAAAQAIRLFLFNIGIFRFDCFINQFGALLEVFTAVFYLFQG
jgi:hypothetical protein